MTVAFIKDMLAWIILAHVCLCFAFIIYGTAKVAPHAIRWGKNPNDEELKEAFAPTIAIIKPVARMSLYTAWVLALLQVTT
jgi:hypothetical protein